MTSTRLVPSTGLSIAVREHTPAAADRPTVVLVHGYPDRQDTWDPLVAELTRQDPAALHLVTYDVRGAGASGTPATTAGYRTDLLLDDLCAVLDAVLPVGGRVHLVGHDWGSVQLWDAVVAEAHDPRLHGRIASFTSISGPSLDHLAWLNRHRAGRRGRLLRQALHATYVVAFHVPVLPEAIWRALHRPLGRLIATSEGLGPGHWGPGLADDAAHGLNLYRANVRRRMREGGHALPHTDVPVLVVRPRHDHYLTDVCFDEIERLGDVRVAAVDAGHWVARTQPGVLAGLVLEQARAHP